MRTLPHVSVLALATTVAAAPALSAQECSDPRTFADWLGTVGWGSRLQEDAFGAGQEHKLSVGLRKPAGCAGRWVPRGELALGMQSAATEFFGSVFGGAQVAVARVFTDPLIRLGDSTRAEPYLLFGGGGYVAYDMPEAPDETSILPNATVGLGLRISATEGAVSPGVLEVVREHRFGEWDARWYLQWSLAWSL